jgi:predicted TIM-barrel fold metal-dependent hydrolase
MRNMIWDLHCHLSGVDGRTPEERIAQIMAYADRVGIERLVFFMGWPWAQDPAPDEFRRQNDQVIQALSHWHHRAFGFAYVNPKHVDESLREIDRTVRDGPLVGIKLWVAERANSEKLDPIIRRAGELKAVIFQHTWFKVGGNDPGESSPADLAELARRHPSVPLICGHSGGDWERGIRAVRATQNVSIGTAGSDPTAGMIEMAVRELGPERIIYGSDIGGRSFASQLAKVQGADVPETAKRLILGGNLQRMMQPILKTKGIAE